MKFIPYLSAFLLLTAAPLVLHAQEAAATAPTEEKAAKVVPFRGTVSAVDAAGGNFTISNKDKSKVRVFTLAKTGKMTRDDKDITFKDVKIGDYARGSGTKMGPDKFEITSAKIGPKTDAEKAADKAKKEG